MFCHKCGYKVEKGARFCKICGTKLIETNNSSIQNSQNTNTQSNSYSVASNIKTPAIDSKKLESQMEFQKNQPINYSCSGDNQDNIICKPNFEGSSYKYKKKIDLYQGFDKIRCPQCGAENPSFVSNTEKRGFSAGDACCGYMIFGTIGILCGALGSNSKTTTEYWMCNSCGAKFQNNEINNANKTIRFQADLLSDTPDEIVDNIEILYRESLSQKIKLRNKCKKLFVEEYKTRNGLKIFAIAILAVIVISIALSIFFGIEFGWIPVVITIDVAITLICFLIFMIKPIVENKYASNEYNQLTKDSKEADEIHNRINAIKVAKQHLSDLKII